MQSFLAISHEVVPNSANQINPVQVRKHCFDLRMDATAEQQTAMGGAVKHLGFGISPSSYITYCVYSPLHFDRVLHDSDRVS